VISKPFLYKFGLMSAVVIKDDMDPPSRVETDYVVKKLYKLLFPFLIEEDSVQPLTCMDVQCSEDTLLITVSAPCRDVDALLLKALNPTVNSSFSGTEYLGYPNYTEAPV